jgi:L-asparaginase
MKKKIALISTGGTIEKTYDEMAGVLANQVNVLDILITSLQLGTINIARVPLMNKDSIEMTEADHTLIARTAGAMADAYDGVVVVHGTDRLQHSGERTLSLNPDLTVPIVFTGAMRPYEMRHTDAVQNITEALLAVQLLSPGVYLAMHNTVLQFPNVVKAKKLGTFVKMGDE